VKDKEQMIQALEKAETEIEKLKKDVRKFMQITLHGHGTYVQPMDQLQNALEGEFDSLLKNPQSDDHDTGEKWTFEIIEMSMFDYRKLPEYSGH